MMDDKAISPYVDPDRIIITKDILRNIMNATIDRWKLDKNKHRVQIMAMETFRVSLRFQSDESIETVCRSIIEVVNKMQYYNAMMIMKGEFPTSKNLADMAIEEIRGMPLD